MFTNESGYFATVLPEGTYDLFTIHQKGNDTLAYLERIDSNTISLPRRRHRPAAAGEGSPRDPGAGTGAAPTAHHRTVPAVWRPNGPDPAVPARQPPLDHRGRCLPPARPPRQR